MLGVVLRRLGLLTTSVINAVSRIAFQFALPVLLFASAGSVDFYTLGDVSYFVAGIVSTLTIFAASWLYGLWRNIPKRQLGVFVQASFRSNLAIIGIALCISAYGEAGVALAALPIAMLTALYNILAVIVLSSHHGSSRSVGGVAMGIVRNPLLIGIGLGVVVSLLRWPVPDSVGSFAWAISTYYMPLALVCIGGSMNLESLRSSAAITWEAMAWRLCVSPAVGVAIALLMGVSGAPLGVLFLLLASPVAAASFVMVVAAQADERFAANVIVLTTLFSIVTVTVGFFVLSVLGLVGEV
ncbi:MAG: putative permease [Halioglobus sp.]|jgi:predicted permease